MASADGQQSPTASASADGGDAAGGFGQLSLFVLGSALLLVGVAVVMGVELGGLLAPEQPAAEVTDTTSATAAASPDGGGRGGGSATATSVATPTNASNATATTTPATRTPPPFWTATPNTTSSPTPSPTPTPTASPTETDDGIVIDDPGDGRGSMSGGRER